MKTFLRSTLLLLGAVVLTGGIDGGEDDAEAAAEAGLAFSSGITPNRGAKGSNAEPSSHRQPVEIFDEFSGPRQATISGPRQATIAAPSRIVAPKTASRTEKRDRNAAPSKPLKMPPSISPRIPLQNRPSSSSFPKIPFKDRTSIPPIVTRSRSNVPFPRDTLKTEFRSDRKSVPNDSRRGGVGQRGWPKTDVKTIDSNGKKRNEMTRDSAAHASSSSSSSSNAPSSSFPSSGFYFFSATASSSSSSSSSFALAASSSSTASDDQTIRESQPTSTSTTSFFTTSSFVGKSDLALAPPPPPPPPLPSAGLLEASTRVGGQRLWSVVSPSSIAVEANDSAPLPPLPASGLERRKKEERMMEDSRDQNSKNPPKRRRRAKKRKTGRRGGSGGERMDVKRRREESVEGREVGNDEKAVEKEGENEDEKESGEGEEEKQKEEVGKKEEKDEVEEVEKNDDDDEKEHAAAAITKMEENWKKEEKTLTNLTAATTMATTTTWKEGKPKHFAPSEEGKVIRKSISILELHRRRRRQRRRKEKKKLRQKRRLSSEKNSLVSARATLPSASDDLLQFPPPSPRSNSSSEFHRRHRRRRNAGAEFHRRGEETVFSSSHLGQNSPDSQERGTNSAADFRRKRSIFGRSEGAEERRSFEERAVYGRVIFVARKLRDNKSDDDDTRHFNDDDDRTAVSPSNAGFSAGEFDHRFPAEDDDDDIASDDLVVHNDFVGDDDNHAEDGSDEYDYANDDDDDYLVGDKFAYDGDDHIVAKCRNSSIEPPDPKRVRDSAFPRSSSSSTFSHRFASDSVSSFPPPYPTSASFSSSSSPIRSSSTSPSFSFAPSSSYVASSNSPSTPSATLLSPQPASRVRRQFGGRTRGHLAMDRHGTCPISLHHAQMAIEQCMASIRAPPRQDLVLVVGSADENFFRNFCKNRHYQRIINCFRTIFQDCQGNVLSFAKNLLNVSKMGRSLHKLCQNSDVYISAIPCIRRHLKMPLTNCALEAARKSYHKGGVAAIDGITANDLNQITCDIMTEYVSCQDATLRPCGNRLARVITGVNMAQLPEACPAVKLEPYPTAPPATTTPDQARATTPRSRSRHSPMEEDSERRGHVADGVRSGPEDGARVGLEEPRAKWEPKTSTAAQGALGKVTESWILLSTFASLASLRVELRQAEIRVYVLP